jgi:hypothetical protein
MSRKRSVIVILVLLYLFCPFSAGLNALAEEPDDPAALLPSVEDSAASESGVTPYTADEFDQLTDDQKKEVYLNSPELLPPNFDPNLYSDLLYSNQ